MAVTMDQVRAALDVDEPNYPAIAQQLGPSAAPQLEQLVRDADPLLASKAAYLASLVGPAAANVVAAAAQHTDPVVRVAAAAATANLPADQAEPTLDSLLADSDLGVRKAALRATGPDTAAAVKDRVARLARKDSDPALRPQIAHALEQLGGPTARGGPDEAERDDARGFGGGDIAGATGSQVGPETVERFGGGYLLPTAAAGDEAGATGGGQLDDRAQLTGNGGQGQGGGDLGAPSSGPHPAVDGGGEVPGA